MAAVNRMFTDRKGKRMRKIWVTGKGRYEWNSVYKVYNHFETYSQLHWHEVTKIDYDK